MTTHYIPAFAPTLGVRVLTICQRYVAYSEHALAPSCPDCHRLIFEEENRDASAR